MKSEPGSINFIANQFGFKFDHYSSESGYFRFMLKTPQPRLVAIVSVMEFKDELTAHRHTAKDDDSFGMVLVKYGGA